jgi:hypothetical protein
MDILTYLSEARKIPPARQWIRIYRDPESSEVDWEGDSLARAIRTKAGDGDEIIQNGITLADGRKRRWVLTSIGEAVLAREKAGKDIMHPVGGHWNKRNVHD